jgi:G6PDH family F420-dependent oxidoreductase
VPPPILVAAGGAQAATLAGEKADGLVATQPDPKLIEAFRKAGGSGPCHVEISLCYAASEEEAQRTVKEMHAWSALGWDVLPELRMPAGFEAASRGVRAEDLADRMPMGPDVERHLAAIREHTDAGYDHIVLSQVGRDQDAFFAFFEKELGPRLKRRS